MESNPRDRVTRVRRGHYAILGGKLDGTAPYFMEGDTLKDTGLLSQLRVMDECLIRQYAALGLIKVRRLITSRMAIDIIRAIKPPKSLGIDCELSYHILNVDFVRLNFLKVVCHFCNYNFSECVCSKILDQRK